MAIISLFKYDNNKFPLFINLHFPSCGLLVVTLGVVSSCPFWSGLVWVVRVVLFGVSRCWFVRCGFVLLCPVVGCWLLLFVWCGCLLWCRFVSCWLSLWLLVVVCLGWLSCSVCSVWWVWFWVCFVVVFPFCLLCVTTVSVHFFPLSRSRSLYVINLHHPT